MQPKDIKLDEYEISYYLLPNFKTAIHNTKSAIELKEKKSDWPQHA